MTISIVVAVAENGVIGKENRLPWRIPEDLAHFKNITMGKTLLMGRKTFESIGKVLPGRRSIVLTRDRSYPPPEGVLVAHGIDEAMALVPDGEIVVVGGSEIYGLVLPIADRIYLTRVEGHYQGDAYFRGFHPDDWSLAERRESAAKGAAPRCAFEEYVRRAPAAVGQTSTCGVRRSDTPKSSSRTGEASRSTDTLRP